MTSEDDTVFQTCFRLNDGDQNITKLLECVSDDHQSRQDFANLDLASGIDSFYLIFAGALVYFMQTGFAMLCAGSIRAKNVKNIVLWNLLDSCGGGLMFFICGYAFAYGGENKEVGVTFIGNDNFFLSGDVTYEFFLFQFAFACALSSIVAGTIAERCKMTAYLGYSTFLVGFVYPIVAHSFWSVNGIFSNTSKDPLWGSGAIDLAGSGPVHMCGGVTALVAAIILGPRIGRFYDREGNALKEPNDIAPHSVALQFLGTFCLWFGWYGFNPGSVLTISTANAGKVAGLVAVNTTLSACAGAMSAMFSSTFWHARGEGYSTYDVGKTMNGCLTGLVSITAGCATVEPWAAVVIGIVGGWLYLWSSHLLVKHRIDDAVDAIPVHMVGGAWGVIATGLFTTPDRRFDAFGSSEHAGWFYEWGRGSADFTLLGNQIVSMLFIIGWTAVMMGALFLALQYFNLLRMDVLEEQVGMDVSRHKGRAYEIEQPHEDDVRDLELRRSTHGSDGGVVSA